MKTGIPRVLLAGSLLLTLLGAAGCATPALWRQTAAHDWKAGPPEQLLLLPTTGECPTVIVLFHQSTFFGDQLNRRSVAWCPGEPTGSLLAVGASARRLTNRYPAALIMPLLTDPDQDTHVSSAAPGHGIWDAELQQLTIHLDGFPALPLTLPDTYTKTETTTRVIMLPLTVAADAALFCLAMIIMCPAYAYH